MLCDNCNKNEATVHYTEVINGIKKEHHLCSECMQEMDYGFEGDFPFSKLIRGILSAHLGNNGQENGNQHLQIECNKCRMSYNEFVKIGKFGCAECYDVFGPLIMENIKKIQGNSAHTGKKYKKYIEKENVEIESKYKELSEAGIKQHISSQSSGKEIGAMKKRLQEALAVEDYEEAARLRDAINLMKERG